MQGGTLYIKFGLDSDYFEIVAEKVNPFKEVLIEDDMPTTRFEWGELLIKNYPYLYNKAISESDPDYDKYRLYALIMQQDRTTEIYVKFIGFNGDEYEGYFGKIDCDISEDKSFIIVTPTIYDQYTYFLEYYDDEVNLFEDKNILLNGDFDQITDGDARYWTFQEGNFEAMEGYFNPNVLLSEWGYIDPGTPMEFESGTLNDKIVGLIPARVGGVGYGSTGKLFNVETQNTSLYQDISIIANKQIKISFLYQLISLHNEIDMRQNLGITLKLTYNTEIKYVDETGNWVDEETIIFYRNNKYALPEDEITDFEDYTLVIQPSEYSGTLRIYFINYINGTLPSDLPSSLSDEYFSMYMSQLALTDIEVTTSDLEYTTVKASLKSDNLVVKELSEITLDSGHVPYKTFYCTPEFSWSLSEGYHSPIDDDLKYYLDEYNDPLESVLDDLDGHWGPHDGGSYDGWSIVDYINLFQEKDSVFYKGELCELTIYECGTFFEYLVKKNWKIRAVAKFAREEYYSSDKCTQTDYIGGYCNEEDIGVLFRPPEWGVGWEMLAKQDSSGKNLWVRTPFNGAYSTPREDNLWEYEEVNTPGAIYGESYNRYIHTKVVYPTSENSKTYNTCINLKTLMKRIYNRTHEKIKDKELYSTFLFNDLPDDAKTAKLLEKIPRFAENTSLNYYTLDDNFLNKIVALHTYQLQETQDPDSDEAELKMTPKLFLSDLRKMIPKTYWFIDSDWNFHFEHLIYEEKISTGVDISQLITKYQYYEYLKDKIFATNIYKSVNSGYADFAYSKVTFDKIVSNRRAIDIKHEITTEHITSDMLYCMENISNLDNGLILLNYIESGTDNVIAYATGQKSGKDILNGRMSIANMLSLFGLWEGIWESGSINDKPYSFKKSIRIKLAKDKINLKGIYKDTNYFLSNLGIGFTNGTKELDYEKRVTNFTPLYRDFDWILIVEENDMLDL